MIFESSDVHEIVLRAQAPSSDPGVFTLTLDDAGGHNGSGTFTFDAERAHSTGRTWGEYLGDYLALEPSADDTRAFGRDLFRAVVEELPDLRDAWSAARGAIGDAPLALTVELGRQTERFASLPLELLHDGTLFLFAHPGSALRRAYRETTSRTFERPASPRLLFAWACPECSGSPFTPEPHAEALQRLFGDGAFERLDNATLAGLRSRLEQAMKSGRPFDYLHVLAHGYRDVATAGLCLATADGALDYVDSQSLAQAITGRGLALTFLCSCQTAVTAGEAFSGVGQLLVSQQGGDLPCVVATQANLPVKGSAELAERFYLQLADHGDPAAALADARRTAYDRGGRAWSVPVLIARPAPREKAGTPREVARLPVRRSTYLDRPDTEGEVLAALREGRLVSLVGLPGIGKTQVGREAARRAVEGAKLVRTVIYREASEGMDTDTLRGLLATALGLSEAPRGDVALASAFEARGGPILLLVDNAEDLMRTDDAQAAFRTQVETLLSYSRQLKILLTTRWPVGAVEISEREVPVPPMSRAEISDLLEREVRSLGVLDESWLKSSAWSQLVDLIDGHPRSLWLISRHFASRHMTLEKVRDRLPASTSCFSNKRP